MWAFAYETNINPLHNPGTNSNSLQQMASYPTGRKKLVIHGGADSQFKPHDLRVMQGSKLEPLLFDVYSSDCVDIYWECTIHADDAVLFFVCTSLQELVQCVTETLQCVKFCCNGFKLRLNET